MSCEAERVQAAAFSIHTGFFRFLAEFNELTRRGRSNFEQRDWNACEADALDRLGLYSRVLDSVIEQLEELLGGRTRDEATWTRIRRAYSTESEGKPNVELAQTFFSSVTRRVFATRGVNPAIEYCDPHAPVAGREPASRSCIHYAAPGDAETLIRAILEDFRFDAHYRDFDGDVRRAARRIELLIGRDPDIRGIDSVDVLRSVFYRMKHAYLVGRLRSRNRWVPFILPLLHDARGIHVDAVLMDESQASILFSFTRAYFHVEAPFPEQIIFFLKSILPQKPVAELYMSLGFNKHGKTELYRGLEYHLHHSQDRFEIATGDRGMVMIVFTLPSYDMVFKIIRDRFPAPKNTTARDVRRRYRLVFERDRVGRLVEAQEFEHLKFHRSLFSDALLAELAAEAAQSVKLDGEHVILEHLYTERRVEPLNLYLRSADWHDAVDATGDYGNAIKELAAANIFPGDFLLKNFGVTRHGRVVFYDYDELCLITDCNFRTMPSPRTPEDELSSEPWFSVAENDIFPEEFPKFLGLSTPLLRVFEREHAELFTVEFWQGLKERHLAGEILDFFPYPQGERLVPSRY